MATRSKKILVVDDDLVIIKTLTMTLTSAGYTVLSATDGGSAIRVIRMESPDLLILDINFPTTNPSVGAWNGFTIKQLLAQLNMLGDRPFIMISGETSKDCEARAKAAGAVAFFQKPFDRDQLLAVIRHALVDEESSAGPEDSLSDGAFSRTSPPRRDVGAHRPAMR